MAQNEYLGEYINRRIYSGEPVKIKLIGDSKLAGLKTTGYEIPVNGTVIFTDPINGTVHRESSINGNGWAHRFERYLNTNFPSVSVDRWGIGGTSTKWWNERIRSVTANEDIVIVDLGTNDRYEVTGVEGFRSDLTDFLDYTKSISNQVIVMVPSPATSESDIGKVFPQKEVSRIVREVAVEMGLPLTSNYDNIMDYIYKTRVPFSELMADGTHPNDLGQDVIWRGVQSALTLFDFDDFVNVDSLDRRVVHNAEPNGYVPADSPNKFKPGRIYINLVYGSSATSGIPGTGVRSGVMVTNFVHHQDGFGYQEYHLHNKNIVYRRYNTLDGEWSA
ncbi:SGNH/GDSL hydrolase family protein [Fundicoccus ignavus]|uniref:SGNH/GDSL hydrolase family protein n=1 Tax=Fundicoccus ignavus TaxID=2664442 RepID=UPI00162A2899|nr:SGNH/GDSL hydrolase family protein [Fundicoccus ignavus]